MDEAGIGIEQILARPQLCISTRVDEDLDLHNNLCSVRISRPYHVLILLNDIILSIVKSDRACSPALRAQYKHVDERCTIMQRIAGGSHWVVTLML